MVPAGIAMEIVDLAAFTAANADADRKGKKTPADQVALARFARFDQVIDLIRGQRVDAAINILRGSNKRVAPAVEKLVRSAIANAENSAGGFGVSPAIAEELLELGWRVASAGGGA